MSVSGRPKIVNVPCSLIEKSDNDILFRLLGQGCSTLASGVVQLFLSDIDNKRWTKRHCGVVCFVKDNPKRSYFIRIFDVKKQQFLWEQELYTQFRYRTPREFFHTFETEDCQAGLNFASEDEAINFKSAVETKLNERHQRKLQRTQRRRNTAAVKGAGQASPPAPPAPPAALPLGSRQTAGTAPADAQVKTDIENKSRKNSTKSKNKKGGAPKRTKADIGTPTDFRHLSHVGWDPDKGFDMDNLQPDMKMLFQSVGIKPDDQVDKETIDFIYDFVGKNGGIEAVRKEMERKPPPPPPPSVAPPQRGQGQPARGPAPSPPPSRRPPPPTRTGPKGMAPPAPGRGPLPKAPPPGRSLPARPSPGKGAPPPPPTGGPPPPPPPPPPPDMNTGDATPNAPASVERHGSTSSSGRGDLLKDLLKGGAHLKKIDPQAEKPQAREESEGLVGALARALGERQKHIQGTDDEDDDDDDIDDDEWDD